jgi:Uma2 family endonuclease
MRLIKLLLPVLPAEYHLRPEQPLTCPDSEPEPDVAVVRGREEDFWQAHPRTAELVIEVCVSSHDFDRFKLRAYASAGVKEVWLVLGPEKQIEVYRQPVGEDFAEHALFSAGQTLVSQVIPEFKIEVAALFAV